MRTRPGATAWWARTGALTLCLCALGGVVVYPTVRLAWAAAFSWEHGALFSSAGLTVIRNTLLIAFAYVLTAGTVGSALAFFLHRYAFPGRSFLMGLAYLPFALPPLVGVIAFYYLIGRDGLLPRFAEQVLHAQDFYPRGPFAILLIHAYSFFVFFYSMVGNALDNLDRNLIEAARTLGASRTRVFFRVTFPLLKPAFVGASLLTFMSSGASFSAPLFFGNDFPVLSVRIYEAASQFNDGEARTLTMALAGVSLLGVLLFRSGTVRARGASKGAPRPFRSQTARWAAGVCAAGCVVLLLTPHLTIIWLSLVDHSKWFVELIPTSLTLAHYKEIFRNPAAFIPIRNSVWMSAVAAGAAFLVGIPAAYLIGRGKSGGRLVNVLIMIPWALPGTVIAMNMIVAFNDPWLPARTALWMLPMAYFVRGIPLFARIAVAGMETFDSTLIEAGRSLGASPLRCLVRIAAPLLGPALAAGAALVFVSSLGEFVASILLYRPDNIPISVQINMQLRGAGIGAAFAYSVLLMMLSAATFVAVRRISSRII